MMTQPTDGSNGSQRGGSVAMRDTSSKLGSLGNGLRPARLGNSPCHKESGLCPNPIEKYRSSWTYNGLPAEVPHGARHRYGGICDRRLTHDQRPSDDPSWVNAL